MPASPDETTTVTYQMPRNVLLRILFRRMMLRPQRMRATALFLVAAVFFYFSFQQLRVLSYAVVALVLLLPIALYRGIVRALDQNPQFTDQKTMQFGPDGILLTGPNYKSELEWSYFKRASEDDSYFYLVTSDTGLDSVIPKSAFTPEQQELFRKLAPRRKK